MSHPKSIGERIIDEIVAQAMISISYPDPDVSHVFVWSSSAVEQLEALVAEHAPKDEWSSALADAADDMRALAEDAAKQADDWKRVAGELAARMKEWEDFWSAEDYDTVAAFEAMERGER